MFAGTHLENAPQWMREIEALTMGGWKAKQISRVLAPKKNATAQGGAGNSRQGSTIAVQHAVPRLVRISTPRAAPRPKTSVRHHHFEQKIILASAKGTISVAEGRAAYGEGFDAGDKFISKEIRATSEAEYIEGSKSTAAERVAYIKATNGDTYEERMKFWELANESAHFVGDHTITVATKGVEESWDQAARNATMPDSLRRAIARAKANEDGNATVKVNDAGVVKRWLAKKSLSFPPELRPHLKLSTPHNSRIAYSIVGQFPHDMPEQNMRECLDRIVDEFATRNIPCQAVIHQPTKKNSEKNFHFHLIYYAGEAERLEDGRWSFERREERDRWRTMKSVPLKRMPRNEEVAAVDWVPKLKRRWSEIVNEAAIDVGLTMRFTNESNKQRGLPKAQTRHSPGRQALHKQGFFTDNDIELNLETWRVWRERRKAQLRRTVLTASQKIERLAREVSRQSLSAPARRRMIEQIDRCREVFKDIDEYIETAAQAATLNRIITSGPADTISHYSAAQKELEGKHQTSTRDAKRVFASEVCASAHSVLAENGATLTKLKAIENTAISRMNDAHRSLTTFLLKLEHELERGNALAVPTEAIMGSGIIHDTASPGLRSRQIAAHFAAGHGMGG